jgi:uncharacterized protein (DUF433 family)
METGIIECGWGPVIAGTRITIYLVLHYLENGWQPAEIAKLYDLSLAEVQAAIQYIEVHKAQVMAVHKEIEEDIARGNPPAVEAKLAIARANAQAKMKELLEGQRRLSKNLDCFRRPPIC